MTTRCCLSKSFYPVVFIPPENTRKPKGFVMFLDNIDKQHRAVILINLFDAKFEDDP